MKDYSKFSAPIVIAVLLIAGIFLLKEFISIAPNEPQPEVFEKSSSEIIEKFNPLPILNPHSHPKAGDHWAVSFETPGGTDDLIIVPNDQATIDDLDFVSLTCNEEQRTPQVLESDIIFYADWSCVGAGKITHLVNIAAKHNLRLEFGDQIAYAHNSPDVEILRPNAAGFSEDIPYEYPTNEAHWTLVDEASQDGDGSFVWSEVYGQGNTPTGQVDYYNLQPSNIPLGSTINSVTVKVIGKADTNDGRLMFYLRLDSATSQSALGGFGNTWQLNWGGGEISRPGGGSWSVEDLADLQAGVDIWDYSGWDGVKTRVTQLYVEVDYTPVVPVVWQPRPAGVHPGGSGGFFMF